MQYKKVIDDITFEMERIEKLIERYNPLLKKVKDKEPDFIELNSLAMLLHSFYNGLENIFGRIARKIDESIPSGESGIKNFLNRCQNKLKIENIKC